MGGFLPCASRAAIVCYFHCEYVNAEVLQANDTPFILKTENTVSGLAEMKLTSGECLGVEVFIPLMRS